MIELTEELVYSALKLAKNDQDKIIKKAKEKKHMDRTDYAIIFQDGTVPENGKNGLQVEEALQQCVDRLNKYQSELPCRENAVAITHIETAILWLNKRTQDRLSRGVEGTKEK